MPSRFPFLTSLTIFLSTSPLSSVLLSGAFAEALPSLRERASDNNPLNIDWDPAPAPEDGPPASANALRDKSYLPAQIGAIVGAYAFSLVIVALTLLCLAKKRREHLKAANDEIDFEIDYDPDSKDTSQEGFNLAIAPNAFSSYEHIQRLQLHQAPAVVPNFSYPSPTKAEFTDPGLDIYPSPISPSSAPGTDPHVDQSVVAADKAMAQSQLEEMYKYVMEHEEAKQKGITLDPPMPLATSAAASPVERHSTSERSAKSTLSKKERNKPANLTLSATGDEKPQSRTSSLFSALRSPKKKASKGVSISSPIMTPQSGTFPRQEIQEMGSIPPRHYAPPPPPPIPEFEAAAVARNSAAPITPDISPQSVQSIDERIAVQLDTSRGTIHRRDLSVAPTENDPESATSMHSSAPLVGLPASPRSPGFHRPSLPSSPKPGASFSRPNPPSAVRTGGSLPLRAYEPALSSPRSQTTKQTVFERKGPLSPTGRTPFTAGAAPYSPYQPYTPVVPMTPSLVTKEDRKRMKRLVPKTPTMEMVQSSDDVW